MSKKVACVIVTYNRLSLLQKCIDSIKSQTYKDFDIIIIDNDSTDGTGEWLDNQSGLGLIIHQENTGGAGGFYSGMKKAYELDYEWMWMMDDDGIADKDQLNNLLNGAIKNESKFVNALVCDVDNPENLAFELACDGKYIKTKNEAQLRSVIPNDVAAYNGTLIHRDVIRKIGFIKKEMFIWGDEVEYYNRARKAGFTLYTITDAIHYHPKHKSPIVIVIPFCDKFKIVVPPANREKIYFRNLGYISQYASLPGMLLGIFKHVLYFLLRFKFYSLYKYVKYFMKGRHDDYSD